MIIPRNLLPFVSDTCCDRKFIWGRNAAFRYEKLMNLVLNTFSFNLLGMIHLMTLLSSLIIVSEITSLEKFLNL